MTPDEEVRAFADSLRAGGLLDPGRPTSVARAPGRLDVMGGIADYSASLVLQLPLAEATHVAAQIIEDSRLEVSSVSPSGSARSFAMVLPEARELLTGPAEIARESLRDTAWASYVVGCLWVLARRKSFALDHGLRLVIGSRVPEGKGVSSSAALEVATLRSVAGLSRSP